MPKIYYIGDKMKFSKILIAALLLICAIGIVSAAALPEIQVPNTFKDLGDGSYSNEADGIDIDIYNDTDLKDHFANDTAVKNTVAAGKINNTYTFTDGVNDISGINELVTINGEQFVIEISTQGNFTDSQLDKFYNALEEVNKLNKLTPEDPSTF